MNANEEKVYEVALESVGSFENYICDNGLEGTNEANISRDKMMDYAYVDVVGEFPFAIKRRILSSIAIGRYCGVDFIYPVFLFIEL